MADPTPSARPSAGEFELRTVGPADLDALLGLDAAAFAFDPVPDFFTQVTVPTLEPDRIIGVFDHAAGGGLVGSAGIFTKDMTFPGGTAQPVAAVTWVAVRPGWQRRGILRALMRRQLADLRAHHREPIAVLTASQAAIYGRFGYGPAIDRVRWEIPARAALQGPPPERVREVDRGTALAALPGLYEAVARTRTGYLSRTPAVWAALYSDHEVARGGASTLRFALHPDGYAAYRHQADWGTRDPNYTLQVHELCAATPAATAALWSHLLNFDLAARVVFPRGWTDDPVQDLLVNPRGIVAGRSDHVWLRIVDLERAVALRACAAAADLRIRVRDGFCPENDGVFRVQLSGSGGRAVRTDDSRVDVDLDVAALGAAFLGGTPVLRLAAAGRVAGDPAAVHALHAALHVDLAPHCPEGF